jgi:hypothetical protein
LQEVEAASEEAAALEVVEQEGVDSRVTEEVVLVEALEAVEDQEAEVEIEEEEEEEVALEADQVSEQEPEFWWNLMEDSRECIS